MKINKASLLADLNKVMPGLATGTVAIENADTLVFANGHIYSYNSIISVDVKCSQEISLEGTVKGQDFYDCISKLPTDEIEIETVNNKWNISSGEKIKVSMNLLPSGEFVQTLDSIKPSENWLPIDGNDLHNALSVCAIKGNVASFAGVYIKDNVALSTNQWIINKYTLKDNYPEIFISEACAEELMKWKSFTALQVNKVWLQFKSDDGVIFSVRTLDSKKFVSDRVTSAMNAIVQNNHVVKVSLNDEFFNVVQRAAVFSNTIDEHSAIGLFFQEGKVLVNSSRVSGDYKEIVDGMTVEMDNISPFKLMFDFNVFLSSEKYFRNLDILSADDAVHPNEPVYVIMTNENSIKVFSSLV